MNGKELYVIGGSNGAGKTTFANEFLPHYSQRLRFINPDLIAAGLSPFDPTSVALLAGRLMLSEVVRSIKKGDSFAFETTLSGKTTVHLIQQAKAKGYTVHLFYLWVPAPELATARIRDRVASGGHDVPSLVVKRRYSRTLHNFFILYRGLADTVHFFDNTGNKPMLIFKDEEGSTDISNIPLYEALREQWGKK